MAADGLLRPRRPGLIGFVLARVPVEPVVGLGRRQPDVVASIVLWMRSLELIIREGRAMPTYIIQSQWTEQGIRNVKESANRLDLGRKKLKEMGGDIKAFYLTTGPYDMLAIIEVPNDATLAAHLLWLGSQGNLRTQTVKAFTEDEFRGIVGKLP
jgi:uncharacterized protein with GYD domain